MLDEDQLTGRSYGNDNTIGLFVSLYLIILAFFLMLTALSSREAVRTVEATDSIQTAFSGSDSTRGSELVADAETVSPTEDPTLNAIDQIIQSAFALQGRYGREGGNIFVVDIPENYLYALGAANVKRAPADIIDQMVKASKAADKNRRADILVVQNTPPYDDRSQSKRKRRLAYRRASSLARQFDEAGIERGSFATGFGPVGEKTLRFQFRTAERYDPSLPLGLPENRIDSVRESGE